MGIWDTTKDIFSGGGASDIQEGYDEAQGYMRPYQEGGLGDYWRMQQNTNNMGNMLDRFQGAGNWRYNRLNQKPQDYYNSIMSGYSESPMAKFEQEQAMRAATNAGSASGMTGSGAFFKGLQENAANIGARDQQRYFNNVQATDQMQNNYLADLRGQQNTYNQMQQYLTNLGYGAAGNMGNNAIQNGLAQAQIGRQTAGDLASMAGYAAGGIANAMRAPTIPAYMR